MARLEVEIGAEIKDLQSKVSQASKDLNKFSANADKDLNKLGKSAKSATKGMGGLQKGAVSGTSAMTAFSRTIQDAPFGIMGVSNNITNLTEQFGYLKNKTGSAKGALTAMLKDLKGFGGISLLISVATSAMLVFGDKIFKTKDKVKGLREEQEKLNKTLDDYVFQLDSVSKANLKGQQSAQKELVTFRLLSEQVQNTTLSLSKRKGAIEDLRKKYPDYLKNMSDEKILNGGLATVYNTLTTSIIKRAKATASMNAIVKNSENLLTIESQLASVSNEKSKAEKLYNSIIEVNKKSDASYRGAAFDGAQRESVALTKLNKLKKEENKLIGQKQTLELTNIDLEGNISETGGIAKAIGVSAEKEIPKVVTVVGETLKNSLNGVQDVLNENPLEIINYRTLTDFEAKAMLMKIKLQKFTEEVAILLDSSKFDALSNIGSAIGNAMSSGQSVLKSVGASLLGTLGDIMVRYGKLAIAFGLTSEALKKAFQNPFGGGIGAVVAGVALVAIGSAIKGFGANVSSGGSGSNASGGSGSNSGGSFTGGSTGGFSNGNGTVVFEIAGRKLIGVLKNEVRSQGNAGTTLTFG